MLSAIELDQLRHDYTTIRQLSVDLVAPLSEADAQIQSMEDASPSKWHLAHTSWFFETFILEKHSANYQPFNSQYKFLFNSYYNGIGAQYTRAKRGLISRPSLREVIDYRQHIDKAIMRLLDKTVDSSILSLIELGLHHEQQHQELLLTDIKHAFFQNPSLPAYKETKLYANGKPTPLTWLSIASGIYEIGHQGNTFCFDNETPRHRVFIDQCEIASRPITNSEYLAFIQAGGYKNPEFWLSDGWAYIQAHQITQPFYWVKRENEWHEFTLAGLQTLADNNPVTHISYYEASAYASWAKKRLPTEAEWEVATQLYNTASIDKSRCLSLDSLHPRPSSQTTDPIKNKHLLQMFGDVWEWTCSAYSAYPGFQPFAGAIGEYNGKFMSNQYVLRGGSCATPGSHIRKSYRNFFYPHQCWQFTGIRLASNK